MWQPGARGPGRRRPAGGPPGAHSYRQRGPRTTEISTPRGNSLFALVGVAFGGPKVSATGGGHLAEAPRRGWRLRAARFLILVAPWLLLAGGALYGAFLPPRFGSAFLFVGAPLIAAPFYALPPVLLMGFLAVLGVAARNYQRGDLTDASGLSQTGTCLVVTALAVLINLIVHRGYLMLSSARRIAAAAQLAVLPEPPERLAGLDVAAHYEAAQAGAYIGGDFYAAQDTPHGVRFVVGDVRGKGMDAVAAVAVVIGAFREVAEQEAGLEAVAQRLDRALARESARRSKPGGVEDFATAVLMEVPHTQDVVRIVNRGHPPPLVLHPGGHVDEVAGQEAALPLGMTGLGSWPDRALEIPFPPDTMLLLYTDGLTEARDKAGVFYDPTARLSGRSFGSPYSLLSTLVDEVRHHTEDGATDDLALLAVRRPEPHPSHPYQPSSHPR